VGARFARWQRAVALWCGADPARGDPAMNRLGEMISGGTVVAPLVFNPISAKLAEAAGFRALYLGGGSLGYVKCVTEANLTLPENGAAGH
jgi:hypothetical protein